MSVVTSVTAVTGGASAASRIASVPDGPAQSSASGPEAVIRAVPSERPARPAVVTGPVTAPAAAPRTPVSPEPEAPAADTDGAAVTAADAETPGAAAVGDDGGEDGDRRRAAGGRARRSRRGPGVRERKRLETRARIVEAAAELFAERGFDAVSVIEIAQRAGVVEKTVFNHFPVKEGLVFESDPPIRAALLDAVRRRPAGESVAAAAGGFVVSAIAVLGTPEAAAGVAEIARVVRGSRTLQIREREILGELTAALAALITEETGAADGHLEPWLAAHAVIGLYAGLLELARNRVLEGATGPTLAAELRDRGERGLALLQFGLAGYAKRR